MFSTMEFKYVTSLPKKLFSVAAVKFFLGLNLFRLSCFPECEFGRNQWSQRNSGTSSKLISAMKVLGICLFALLL